MIQQGQRHSNSKSRTLGFAHKQSEDIKEIGNYFSGPLIRRPSHSGPLVPGSGLKVGERLPASNKVNQSKLSGLVAPRTSLSGDQEEKPVLLRPEKSIQVQKSFESTNGSESRRRHDKKHHSQRIDLRQIENGAENLIQVSFFN